MEQRTEIDTTAAEAYEKFLVPTLNPRVAAKAVEMASLHPGEHVLDVACGTGIAVRIAAPRVAPGGSVTGVDIDPAMLAVGRAVVAAPEGVTIDWRCAGVQAMPFENASFDVAICVQGLQYFPDSLGGLIEIRRTLKSGGRAVVAIWSALEDCKGQQALARALEHRGVAVPTIYKAYSFGGSERLRALAGEAGFRDIEVQASSTTARFSSISDFVEAFASGSLSSRAAIAKVPEDERAAFLREVTADLKQYENGNGVVLPLGYLLMSARA
jgi:ubiquinone/menaquinone biosynthesis C-methylase UbiE